MCPKTLPPQNCHRVHSNVPVEPFLGTITSPTHIYLLGFMWADGYISSDKNRISIEITSKDFIELEPILAQTGKWNIYHRTRINRQPQSSAVLSDNIRLCNLLREYNYCSKDGLPTILTNIPEDLHHHWFRGLSDGDGCFYHGPITKPFKDRYMRQYLIGSTYEQDWSYMVDLCYGLDITYSIKRMIAKNGNKSSIFRINGKANITKYGNYIYQDSQSLRFTRKYQKFLDILA